ncbi:MAG: hypothetical protein ACJ76S_07020 [Solirubrobacteraceae bacterium]|jgi:hypothetical protein
MKWAALITWVLTAGGGFVMLGLWLKHGGRGQRRRSDRRISPPMIFGHFALAATGLVIWIVYVVSDQDVLAWVAVALLVPVALLGFTMLAIWVQQRQQPAQVAMPAQAPPGPAGGQPAEQRFPVPVVILHGLLAVATLALAVLTAAGVGGS